MIDLSVRIPDNDLAREALTSAVLKINKAGKAAKMAKEAKENKALGIVTASKKDKPVKDGEVSPHLKDFGISDIRAIIKANDVKIGVGNGKKPDAFYFELLSKADGLDEMVKAYKLDQLGGYD